MQPLSDPVTGPSYHIRASMNKKQFNLTRGAQTPRNGSGNWKEHFALATVPGQNFPFLLQTEHFVKLKTTSSSTGE